MWQENCICFNVGKKEETAAVAADRAPGRKRRPSANPAIPAIQGLRFRPGVRYDWIAGS
jgi:hypothetical protein